MEYRNSDFIKYYEKYLMWFDSSKQSTQRHGEILCVRTNFTMNNQAQVITNGCGVYYTNMYQLVFGELRPFLKLKFNRIYLSIDWELTAEELIDDLLSEKKE